MTKLLKKIPPLARFNDLLKRYQEVNRIRKRINNCKFGLNIVVGSGKRYEEGWIPTDIDTLNLLKESDWQQFFEPNSIDAILAEHVWEHLSENDSIVAARNCFKYLKNGGYLRIAVPDGFHPDTEYINHVKPPEAGVGVEGHENLYTYKSLQKVFQKVGFRVTLLEYFDEHGNFHFSEWNPSQGKINRSKRFDRRNTEGKLKYTSIIIDAVKKDT